MTSPGDSARALDEMYNLGVYGDHRNGNGHPEDDKPGYKLRVHNAAEVQPKTITWLWPGRFPVGKFCMLAGDPGLGKSYMALDIAARVSLGGEWPDGGGVLRGNVLIISVEDGMADTIVPRLIKLGADLSNVQIIEAEVTSNEDIKSFNLTDHLLLLEEQVLAFNASVLILDPILAFTGAKDTHRSSDVRAVLAPLANMADRTGCTILSIIHLNKKSGEFNSVYRLTGSLDFAAAARSVMVVGKHPDIEGRRVFAPVKMNLSAMPPALEYSFTDDGVFSWGNQTDLEANDILATPTPETQSARDKAEEFLRETLGGGPVFATALQDEAREAGHKSKTLDRASRVVGVHKYQVGNKGTSGTGGWVWSLSPKPDDWK